MRRTPLRLIVAAVTATTLGAYGALWYSTAGDAAPLTAAAAGVAEGPAYADPAAKGSPPRSFTVPGHRAYIDATKLKGGSPKKRTPQEEMEHEDLPVSGRQGTGPAAPVQSAQTAAAAPAPQLSVKGLDFKNWGAGHPPDTAGVVGPNHYVQVINTSIGMFDKSTGNRVAAFTFNTFMNNSGTPECDSYNQGDPTVVYDVPSGKWILANFSWISSRRGPFYECVAVSSGSDPVNSTWTFYSVPAGEGALPDYPKFGSGPDGVYFTTNNFASNRYKGASVYALQRSSLGATSLKVQHVSVSSTYFSLMPANTVEAAPAAGPQIIASIWGGQIRLWKYAIDWANASNTTFTLYKSLAVSYSSIGDIPTLGEAVDSLSPRVMNKAQLQGGSLWLTHSVASGSVAGVRWYEISDVAGAPAIRQQSTYAPADGKHRWMPSLAVDKQGNMAVGYSVANGSTHPSIRYAGRLASDPLNTLGQSETSLIEGTGSPSTGNYGRWGDYAEMSVDPTNGCTFWFTTEYYEVTGADHQTRIGSFTYPGCA